MGMWLGKHSFNGIDQQRKSNQFVTSGTELVEVWDINR